MDKIKLVADVIRLRKNYIKGKYHIKVDQEVMLHHIEKILSDDDNKLSDESIESLLKMI